MSETPDDEHRDAPPARFIPDGFVPVEDGATLLDNAVMIIVRDDAGALSVATRLPVEESARTLMTLGAEMARDIINGHAHDDAHDDAPEADRG